jgi:hypothetical protein
VPFRDHAESANCEWQGPPRVIVALDAAAQAELEDLVEMAPPDGRVLVGAFQGQQMTGGYAIRIERLLRTGDVLRVEARLQSPAPESIVTQALTSPVHVVAVERTDVSGVRTAVLVDQSGAERARADVR